MFQVEGCRVAKHHQLDQRWYKDDQTTAFVLEQGLELFDRQSENASPHAELLQALARFQVGQAEKDHGQYA